MEENKLLVRVVCVQDDFVLLGRRRSSDDESPGKTSFPSKYQQGDSRTFQTAREAFQENALLDCIPIKAVHFQPMSDGTFIVWVLVSLREEDKPLPDNAKWQSLGFVSVEEAMDSDLSKDDKIALKKAFDDPETMKDFLR
jgi:hypothetical protein